MSDESMVERAAKAIAASQGWSWEDVNQPLFLGSARAAIEAMREPTEAMADRAADEVEGPPCDDYSGGEPVNSRTAADVWRAMITAALPSPPK